MKFSIRKFLANLGPGIITGASDDDPSGIATYSQAGAQFGMSTLWTALLATPLMISIQEMCARIGVVTKHGLAGIIARRYSRSVLLLILLLSFPAITLNIGADIYAVGSVLNLLAPQAPTALYSIVFTVLLTIAVIKFSYKRLSSLLKWLCIALFAYIVVPFLVKENLAQILYNTFIPAVKLNKDFVLIFVALMGTTISPYLFFWQASTEVEETRHKHIIVNKKAIHNMREDVDLGMVFSNLVMFFIILATGTVLFKAGITNITTVSQAALALKPLAGNYAYLLFALGVIGAGCLAIPVLAGSLSYMYSEVRGKEGSMDKKFHQAKGFYMILILSTFVGLLLGFIGINVITMLIYTALIYGLIAPVLIAIILHISNNRSIMGRYANGFWSNTLGIITLAVMAVSAILFLYLQFL